MLYKGIVKRRDGIRLSHLFFKKVTDFGRWCSVSGDKARSFGFVFQGNLLKVK